METIKIFLSDPLIGLIGYLISFIASVIAILQFFGKYKVLNEVGQLRIEIAKLNKENTYLQSMVTNKNKVQMGEKSQYFQDNSGAVNIDNRG